MAILSTAIFLYPLYSSKFFACNRSLKSYLLLLRSCVTVLLCLPFFSEQAGSEESVRVPVTMFTDYLQHVRPRHFLQTFFFHCQNKWGLRNHVKEVFIMCVNLTPSIYGNSRLETNWGLALSLSSAYDSKLMGSTISHQGQNNSLRYHHLQLIQSTVSCLFLPMSDHILCVPGSPYLCSIPPLFGKSIVEEETHGDRLNLVALPFISSSLPSASRMLSLGPF